MSQVDALQYFLQPKELSSKSKCFCQNCGKNTYRKQVLLSLKYLASQVSGGLRGQAAPAEGTL